MIKIGESNNAETEQNPYTSTAKSKTTSKPLFSGKGSSSLVRPKRIIYPAHGDSELAPIDHDLAKQKLENLFTTTDEGKKDPLSLLTKPKKKLNLLKRLPNDEKYRGSKKLGMQPLYFSKDEVKLNSTGSNQMKMSKDSDMWMNSSTRITTAQTQSIWDRTGTRGGRTRTQIISEFFCSQNWNYLAQKVIMVKKEREGMKNCIVKFRKLKRGLKLFWKVYKSWIARVKIQREEQIRLEEEQRLREIEQQQFEEQLKLEEEEKLEEEQRLRKYQPDEVQHFVEVKKCEFVLSEDNDIFSLNEGVDLSKFKEGTGTNTDDYHNKIKEIKQDKKKIKEKLKESKKINKLDAIPEEVDESVYLSPFRMRAGKVLAAKLTNVWQKKLERKEGKKIRQLLKNLPPQCRSSYIKLMQLRQETADLQSHFSQFPRRPF